MGEAMRNRAKNYDEAAAEALRTLAITAGVPLEVLGPAPDLSGSVFVGDNVAPSALVEAQRDIAETIHRRAITVAAAEMLNVIDSWIEGAKENHQALGHNSELRGDECWERFHVEDIRSMVDDMCHTLDAPLPERDRGAKS